MRNRTMLALVLALGGCAAPAASSRVATTTPASATAEGDLASAREVVRRQRERIRELEAALGLARAEARQLSAELRELTAAERARITRIGAERAQASEAPVIEEAPRETGPRPVLRLYGPAPVPGPEAPPVVAAPPLPSIRLPVVLGADGDPDAVPAIPASPLLVSPPVASAPPPEPPRPAPADDPAVASYREGLAHLSARRLDEALAAFDSFLRAHPHHAYADNALYWRGEIHYARRDYRRALAELSALVERYPRGNKVAEALLRIGLCHERMGDRQRAREVFHRLRTQYPDSVAARMASREDV
ncbi:MAG: tol-pal system protein YbgF [Sandaracinaceae bacterium]|nr:tol-pal system protein YbgF [Sandaracinaceae bacterium]